MADDLRVRGGVVVPAEELVERFSRSSGPGGQSVNTSDTRVELSYDVARSRALRPVQRERALARLAGRLADGVVTVAAQEHRSQLRNRAAARDRLAELLAEAVAPPARPRRPTRPTASARRRRVEGKRARGETKRLRRPPEG